LQGDKAPYDKAPYDKAPYDEAPYDKAPYDEAPYDEAPYDEAPYATKPGRTARPELRLTITADTLRRLTAIRRGPLHTRQHTSGTGEEQIVLTRVAVDETRALSVTELSYRLSHEVTAEYPTASCAAEASHLLSRGRAAPLAAFYRVVPAMVG
jgi:hypothetical protein